MFVLQISNLAVDHRYYNPLVPVETVDDIHLRLA